MTHTFETHYADLRRRAVLQLEARQKECDALDPAFTALRAKRSRVFSMPAQGAKLTLSTLRLEEDLLILTGDGELEGVIQVCDLGKDGGILFSELKSQDCFLGIL